MSLFPTLLWKEWRDHRAALIGYFVAIPPLVAWGLTPFSAAMRRDPIVPSGAALCGFLVAALTLFGDLFANEEQRGTIRLLRRLPGGLSRVFIGKVAFALLAALAMSGWAYLAATGASAWLHGGPLFPALKLPSVAWLTPLLPLCAWLTATAIWLSRATLALPAAALTLLLFSLPIAAATWLVPGLGPTLDELRIASAALVIGGPLVAGVSFVLGRRRTAGAFAPVGVGLVATLLLFIPAYAWTGMRVARFVAIEPDHSSFRLDYHPSNLGALSSNGRYAYVRAYHVAPDADVLGVTDYDPGRGDSPLRPLCVDLESGAWSVLGDAGAQLLVPECGSGPAMERVATPIVGVVDEAAFRAGARSRGGCYVQYLDADRGEPFDAARVSRITSDDGAVAGALRRRASCVQLPDGRRAWRQEGQLWIDPGRPLPDSHYDVGPIAFWWFSAPGFGSRVGDGEWYDLMREKRYRVGEDIAWVRWIRPGRWIVWERTVSDHVARLYDPDTREMSPIVGLGKLEDLVALAEDGRMVVVSKTGFDREAPRELRLLDPESGAVERLELSATVSPSELYVLRVGRTPAGRSLLRLLDVKRGRTWFARLDLGGASARLVVTSPLDGAELLGSATEDSLVAIESARRLVRLRFDGSPPELLFPR